MALVNFVARVTKITAAWLNKLDYTSQYRVQHWAVDSGVINAYMLTTPSLAVDYLLTTGTMLQFKALVTNTGPATVNGVAVLDGTGTPLIGGEIRSTGITTVVYNGTSYILQFSQASASDAATLNGQAGSYYLNSDNQSAGTLAVARGGTGNATGSGINITGKTGTKKTLSSSAPSGGSDGDTWDRY